MNFEPQNFFIGLIDFFSILLPGALLTFFVKDHVGPRLLGTEYYQLADLDGGMVFLFSSYLSGHFIFLIGSGLLDNWYDAIRNATYEKQIERLAKGKKLSLGLNRLLAVWLVKKNADRPVNQAARIKEHYLDPLQASAAINTFQWSKARLTLEHPEAIATVHRFEADSKFFRSLVVVLCILILWGLANGQSTLTITSTLLLGPAFWRYVDQRIKATNQAYWYIITLEGNRDSALRQPSPIQTDGPSHAGGVVFRQVSNQVEYLLVQAKNNSNEWVLPKGHIETGELMQEAAVREVREETGAWAQVKSVLKESTYAVNGEPVRVQFYLMQAVAEGRSTEGREHVWLQLEKAVEKATHGESKELLELAEQSRTNQRPLTKTT